MGMWMMRRKIYYYRVRLIADALPSYSCISFLARMPTPDPPPLFHRAPAPRGLPRKILLLKTGEHRPLLEFERIV